MQLTVAKARELRDALDRCIEQASTIEPPTQAALWSEETTRRVAMRNPKRRRGVHAAPDSVLRAIEDAIGPLPDAVAAAWE